jgi:stage II sporulation protein D
MASLAVVQAAPELELPAVRVLLGDDFDSVSVSSARTYRIDAIKAQADTVTFYSISPMVIRRTMNGLMLVDRGWYILETNIESVRVCPQEQGGHARVNGRAYRGELRIRSAGEDALAVVNQLGMEPYLFGVVPGEIGFFTPDIVQAIEAQAVAARTYAFSHLGQYGAKDYDLRADVMDQVYLGVRAEMPIVTAAVWETRGRVLKYNGEYVKAYYHSTCGGRTEAIDHVWERPPEPYLVGADDDEYCSWSNYWDWKEICTRHWLDSNVAAFIKREKLGNRKLMGKLVTLRVKSRRATGRVDELQLVFEHAQVPVLGDRSRWALGRPSRNSGILPSANYTLQFDVDSPNWTKVTVRGHGYGHGVGMCQCGAIGRARAGQSYADILLHYYTNARLEQVY